MNISTVESFKNISITVCIDNLVKLGSTKTSQNTYQYFSRSPMYSCLQVNRGHPQVFLICQILFVHRPYYKIACVMPE